MNNIIKSLIIILILNSSFLIHINSQEMIITIPEKFNINEFPLPPFPAEVIKKLEVINYQNELLNSIDIRTVELNEIEYKYYPEFLKKGIHNKSLIYQTGKIETDFNSIYIGYIPEYFNNFFSISGSLGYQSSTNEIELIGSYNEYRLPVNLGLEFDIGQQFINLSIGQNDYYREWFISPELKLNSNSLNIHFHDDRFIKPLIDISFISLENSYGVLALGWDFFRLGITLIDLNPLPFIQYNKDFDNWGFLIDSKVDLDLFDYSVNLIYRKNLYMRFGLGMTLDENYSDITPYISFKENILPGERTYRVSMDEINILCSFIKDDFASIISLDINNMNNYNFELEMNYKEYGLGSSFEFNTDIDDYSIGLYITYKAGKL